MEKIYEKYKKGFVKFWVLIICVNICSIYEWCWIFYGIFLKNCCKNIMLLCNLFYMKYYSILYVRFDDFYLIINNEVFF